jgi:hypothetical protein
METPNLLALLRELQLMLTATQDQLSKLSDVVASQRGSLDESESPLEEGEPAMVSPIAEAETGEPEAEILEQGAADADSPSRHDQYVSRYGLHIPADGQSEDDFRREELKGGSVKEWMRDSAPFLVKQGAFPKERVASWPSFPSFEPV